MKRERSPGRATGHVIGREPFSVTVDGMRRTVIGAAVLLAFAVAACGGDDHGGGPSSSGPKPLRVVATTTVTGDLARNVGGGLVDVVVVVKANVDPHDFE